MNKHIADKWLHNSGLNGQEVLRQAGPQQQQAGWCRKQEEGRAYPAVHDKLNALPLELLCGIYGNLAIIGTQDMVMGIHQPHSHNVLSRWRQSVNEYAARLHVKLQRLQHLQCHQHQNCSCKG